tara:strand:+ start:528 stop:917 length:390 start_codon:yes stop_codon:yes gene_type:complete
MKSRLEKVYNKLPNQKVDLKAHKVELNVVSELTSIASSVSVFLKNIEIDIEELERIQSEFDSFKNSLEVDLQDLTNEANKLDLKLQEASELANELGVNPSELNQYENSFDLYDEAMEKINEANSKLSQI